MSRLHVRIFDICFKTVEYYNCHDCDHTFLTSRQILMATNSIALLLVIIGVVLQEKVRQEEVNVYDLV